MVAEASGAPAAAPDLPTPPWRRSVRRPTPQKRPITRDLILDVSLRVLDEEGFDALSMRRIAEELDTGPATLYGHFANKDDLLEQALDRVMGEIEVPAPDAGHWQDQVKQVARASYRALISHRDLARASLGRIRTGPNALRVSEALLAIMVTGGVPVRLAAGAVNRIFLYVNADAYEGSLCAVQLRSFGEKAVAGFLGQVREYYATLPAEKFPYTSRSAAELVAGSCEERFEVGLALLVDGLAARVNEDAARHA